VTSGGKSKNKARSVPATPEQNQEVDFEEEGEEVDAEDQQDEKTSAVSLQQEVKDLSAKLNQVLGGKTDKASKRTQYPPGSSRCAIGPGKCEW
jgi:hypothetical protein